MNKFSKQQIGLTIVFGWFFFGGIGHFVMTDFFVSIVPPYLPNPLMLVYVSGVLELLGAFGILLSATRRVAGLGLFMLTLCVTPANVHMWLHPVQFPDLQAWSYSVRLVIQVLLLACIWWSTQSKAVVIGK